MAGCLPAAAHPPRPVLQSDRRSHVAFIAKNAVIAIVVMWFAYKLSIERGPPIVLILLAIRARLRDPASSTMGPGRDVYAIGGTVRGGSVRHQRRKKLPSGATSQAFAALLASPTQPV